MSDKPWIYFGCGKGQKGHYLYAENGQTLHRYGRSGPDYQRRFSNLDGIFPPQPEPANEQDCYRASVTRLGGWGYTVLAWWDRSEDTRSASNSAIYVPYLNIAPEIALEDAKARFPWVFSRTPQPVELVPGPQPDAQAPGDQA